MGRIEPDVAVQCLRDGRVVAIPTETVYGLAADATNPVAVRQVFALKGRPVDHPLILHLAPGMALADWAEPNETAQALTRRFWPGPLTVVLPRKRSVIDEVTGGRDTVALRMPAHPLAQRILTQLGRPLAAPSANRFGRVSPTTADHVLQELPDIDVVDGGPCQVGLESTIVDVTEHGPAILRPGWVSRAQVREVVGPLKPASTTAAPGTLERHYAPRTSLLLTQDVEGEVDRLQREGRSTATLRADAASLYAELRRLDQLGVDVLVAELAEDEGVGEAINDRLRRAARKT